MTEKVGGSHSVASKGDGGSEINGSAQTEMQNKEPGTAEAPVNRQAPTPLGYSMSKQRIILMMGNICAAYIFFGLVFSIPPAFYPTEAEDRGLTAAEYGFVFGIANMSAAIFAVIFAIVGGRVGAKAMLVGGNFAQFLVGGLLFGTLAYVDDGTLFLALSYILRFLFGAADAAVFGSSLALLIRLFSDRFATIFSLIETSFGFGYAIGPFVGSVMYEAGGFELPFYTAGAVGFLLTCTLIFTVPNIKENRENQKGKSDAENKDESASESRTTKTTLGISSILLAPSIWLPYVDNLLFQWGQGFVEGMLEPYAKDEAGASQDQVGLLFLALGLVYMVAAPVQGQIIDRIPGVDATVYSLVANVIGFVAFLLLGPAIFLDGLEPSVGLLYSAMAVLGLGSAMIQISTFARAHSAIMSAGYSDDIETYLVMSGTWTFSFYAGNFMGPTVGGFLVDGVGFRKATTLYLSIYAAMAAVDAIDIAYKAAMKDKMKKAAGEWERME